MNLDRFVGIVSLVVGIVSILYAWYSNKKANEVQVKINALLDSVQNCTQKIDDDVTMIKNNEREFMHELNGKLLFCKDTVTLTVLDSYDHLKYGEIKDIFTNNLQNICKNKEIRRMLDFIHEKENKGHQTVFTLKCALNPESRKALNDFSSQLKEYGITLKYTCND